MEIEEELLLRILSEIIEIKHQILIIAEEQNKTLTEDERLERNVILDRRFRAGLDKDIRKLRQSYHKLPDAL